MEDPVIAEDGQTYEREAIATARDVANDTTAGSKRVRTVKSLTEKWQQGSGGVDTNCLRHCLRVRGL
jgi:hypothetical protein